MAVSDWSTTAASNASTLGIDIGEGCDAANINNALREMMAQLKAAVANIPTGTVMLFAQTSAPTGWTKSTTYNDYALRVVSGTASSGGSANFSSVFGASVSISGTTGSHVLTIAEMPAHQHGGGVVDTASLAFAYGSQTPSANSASQNISTNSGAGTVEGLTESIGGGGGHTHSFSGSASIGAIKYVDTILASKAA